MKKINIFIIITLFLIFTYQGVEGENIQKHIENLKDSDSKVRYEAAKNLKEMGSDAEEAVPALSEVFKKDDEIRKYVAEALVQIGKKSIPVFIEFLESEEEAVREYSAMSLGNFESEAEKAIPQLIELVYYDSSKNVRMEAATTLGEIGSKTDTVLPALAVALGDDFQVARAARVTIDKIDSEADIVDSIIKALKHDEIKIRKKAVRALEDHTEKAEDAVPVLIQMLEEDEDEIKKEVLKILEDFGAEAEDALSYLEKLVLADDKLMRRRAINAIESIDPEYNLIDKMINKIDEGDEKIAERALWVLEEKKGKDRKIISRLQEIFENKINKINNWWIVWRIVDFFKKIDTDIDHPAFLVLKEEDRGNREKALRKLAEKEAEGALFAAAGVEEEFIQEQSIQELLKIVSDKKIKEQIINEVTLAKEDNKSKLKVITRVISAYGAREEKIISSLIGLLNFDEEIATKATELIKEITDTENIEPVVINALNSKNEDERKAATEYLEDKAPFWCEFKHSEIKNEIGKPAIAKIGMDYPQIDVYSARDTLLTVKLIRNNKDTIREQEEEIKKGEKKEIAFNGELEESGNYEIRVVMKGDEKSYYDSFYFHINDEVIDKEKSMSEIVYLNQNEELVYVSDYRGNRLPDFSSVGYKQGEEKIPDVPVKITLEPSAENDTEKIQSAIDEMAEMSPDKNGIRGAILLKEGVYEIKEQLNINKSGIILRGEGTDAGGTVLLATGERYKRPYEGEEKDSILFNIKGAGSPQEINDTRKKITDIYIPVGAKGFHIEDTNNLQVGDKIMVHRPSTKEWISAINMDKIVEEHDDVRQWSPGDRDLYFDRVITDIKDNYISIDAPVGNSIAYKFGGGSIYKYEFSGRISNVGIENMRLVSVFDEDKTGPEGMDEFEEIDNENHAWDAIMMDNIKNGWVTDVEAYHFANSVVNIGKNAKWITVQDSKHLQPVSQVTGMRRYSFSISGQLNLVQRTFAEYSRHAYVVHNNVSGPNVFLHGISKEPHNSSEPHHRWSVAGLYDNIEGNIVFQDRQYWGTGHGWAGANYVAWNTRGRLVCQSPPTAQNYAIGHVGKKGQGNFKFAGGITREDGYWESHNQHVEPESLYLAQLKARLGEKALDRIGY